MILRDKQSGLKQVYVGAGLTYSDTLVLSWKKIFTNKTATLQYKIDVKDGTRAFVRIRAIDNGEYSFQVNYTFQLHSTTIR